MAKLLGERTRRGTLLVVYALAISCSALSHRINNIAISDHGNGHHSWAQFATKSPQAKRWQHQFSTRSGYLFFKHIRKAGGTAMRNYLFDVMKYHGHGTLEQFLSNTEEKEATRHFPFMQLHQQRLAQNYYNQSNEANESNAMEALSLNKNKVYYLEQEFASMDWGCRDIDPRWNISLSVIVLRHPIERHLSEFFILGPALKLIGRSCIGTIPTQIRFPYSSQSI